MGEVYQVVPYHLRNELRGDPMMHDLLVTDLGRYPDAYCHYYRRPRGAREHILILCERGHGICQLGEHIFTVKPKQFVLIPADVPHEYGADDKDPWTISWCHFVGPEGVLFCDRAPIARAPYAVSSEALEETRTLFRLLFEIIQRGFSRNHLTVSTSLVRAILTVLLFDNTSVLVGPHARRNRHVEQAVNFIQKNMHLQISVENIAEATGLSRSRLNQLFRECVGESPTQYLTKERLLRACHYLEATDASISQLADLVGYPDALHFSRVFKKILGISPRQYRNDRKDLWPTSELKEAR